ncbi:MAG: type II toxin-antitoxin system VapC family toxin [Sphingomonas sp.]
MIVLDTHALIWLIDGSDTLSHGARALIEAAREEDGAFVSAITPWEISTLVDKGRIHLAMSVADWMDFVLNLDGMRLAPLEASTGVDAGRLPGNIHGDPADRIVIATARALRCPLLTSDQRILRYAREGHVRVIDAGK